MNPLRVAQALLFTFLGAFIVAYASARAEDVTVHHVTRPSTLVIIGASYAEQWGTPRLPGYTRVINRGIDGQETSDMMARFQRDVIAARPDAVLIWGHANNIVRAKPGELLANKVAIGSDYERMIDMAQAAGIEVILATDVPWTDDDGWLSDLRAWIGKLRGKESYATRISAQISDANAYLRTLAARKGCKLLDFEPVFANSDGTRKREFAKDDLSHITPAGYKALSAYAARELGRPIQRAARVG